MGGSGLDRTDDFQTFHGSGLDRIQFYRIRTGLGLKNFTVRSSLPHTKARWLGPAFAESYRLLLVTLSKDLVTVHV